MVCFSRDKKHENVLPAEQVCSIESRRPEHVFIQFEMTDS